MTEGPSSPSPWYREPLVWLVVGIPAAAVVAGAVMLVLANVTWDGLVTDDYYQHGLQINRSLARDAEATRRGLRATGAFPAPGIVTVRLDAEDGPAAASEEHAPILRFGRAARTGADVTVQMIWVASGVWHGVLPEMASGKWYVELGNDEWRLTAPVWIPASRAGFVLYASDDEASQASSF